MALLLDSSQPGVTGGAHPYCCRLRVSHTQTHRLPFLVFITVLIITIVEQNATIAEVVVYYVIQYIFTSNIIQMPYPGGLKR